MSGSGLEHLVAELATARPVRPVGRVVAVEGGLVKVSGLMKHAALGDQVRLATKTGISSGEVVALSANTISVLCEGGLDGVTTNDRVLHQGPERIAPDDDWLGRIIDPAGRPLDGETLLSGIDLKPVTGAPLPAMDRRAMGKRVATGLKIFDTLLPLVRGQRVGLFAGSGVGKSTLLAQLALGVEADVVVIALAGERSREIRYFTENILGPQGMKKAVVVAAASDQSALTRRKTLLTAMTVAEHFRDKGQHVLFLADSITRMAEAHREVAIASGEAANLREFPPSLTPLVSSLAERAGPGAQGQGDITAIFTVLVAGSDMDEPVADLMRGILDGHIVLDREIAERGRFPAVDVLRSVSRSLPDAASADENTLIARARKRLGAYAKNELMVQAGLYEAGTDPELDIAIALWPELDAFVGQSAHDGVSASFQSLANILDSAEP